MTRCDQAPKARLARRTREKLEEALKNAGEPVTETSDCLNRLRMNGILAVRNQGTAELYRFALDPVAEFIGAEAIGDQCGANRGRWEKVFRESSGAPGFQNALRLTLQAYGTTREWPRDL